MSRKVLKVAPTGEVAEEELNQYEFNRREAVSRKLAEALHNAVTVEWLESLSEADLFDDIEKEKYLGDASGQVQAIFALNRIKAAASVSNTMEIVSATQDFINFFCGFHKTNARLLTNAVHFQYRVDTEKFLAAALPPPSAACAPGAAVKALFDENVAVSGELLLRTVMETKTGLVANFFSPGMPMGKLLKLPVFAQFVLVLINAVEAIWIQEALPNNSFSINIYVSLLVEGAPVEQMVEGVNAIEVMELSKGTKRGPHAAAWIKKMRDMDKQVLIDDFAADHPCLDSAPDGIKTCVFANAFHTLQAFKEDGAVEVPTVQKEKINSMNYVDFYGALVPMHQPNAKILIMEGSENCKKSEKTPGPPLDLETPASTVASAHVYQTAARTMLSRVPGLQMRQQGGRALYDGEEFDEEAKAVIQALGIPAKEARATAGTMAFCGQEALRRWALQKRVLVQGIVAATDAFCEKKTREEQVREES